MLDLLFTGVMPLWMCSILDHAEAFPASFSKWRIPLPKPSLPANDKKYDLWR